MKSVRNPNVWTADNIVKSPYPDINISNVTVVEYIWKDISKWANRTAVVCAITNRSYTYRNLQKFSENFAATLRSQFQIKNGDVVGIMMYNNVDYPIALIGSIQAGAIVTTFNPKDTTREVYIQLLDSKPKIIIGSPETIEIIKEAVNLTKSDISIILVQNPEDNLPAGTISFIDLINNDKIDKSVLNKVKSKPEDEILLVYSSGTTGLPKGVQLTNRNLVANFIQQEVEGVKLCENTTDQYQESIMVVLPMHHSYGLSYCLLHKLSVGLKVVVLPKFQPKTFLNAMKEHKVSFLPAVPAMLVFLGSHPDVKKEHLVSLKKITSGAATLSKMDVLNVLDKCQPGLIFIHCYGMTEVSPLATSTVPGSTDFTTVGYLLPNTELRVVDSNDRNLGPDEVGELYIRGPQVMKGYRNIPDDAKNISIKDGWFRTGDLATINGDGAIYIVGRIKEIIKVKGYQVAPAELEGILKSFPGIVDAAVVGIPDEKKGEVPKAFVVLKEGNKIPAPDILEFVNNQVAEYKRLKEVDFLDDLPRNSSGKILRSVLIEKYC